MTVNRPYSVLSTQYSVPAALVVALLMAVPLRAGEYVQKQGNGVLRLEPDNPKIRNNDSLFKVDDGLVEARFSVELLLTLSVEGKAPLKITGGALAEQVQALGKSDMWFSCNAVGPEAHTTTGSPQFQWEGSPR